MFLAIDVGGTKILIAAFTQSGEIKKSIKLKTPKDYSKFISIIKATLVRFEEYKFNHGCVALPGLLDRDKGKAIAFGNLTWKNKSVRKDLEAFMPCKFVIENDGNLAGLYEARAIPNYQKVLYLTVSTGIGSGIIISGKIDPNFADSEVGQLPVQYNDSTKRWEDVASGRAIKKQYGKIAAEINDTKTWRAICYRLAIGISSLIATIQPDAIVIGGSIGTHFNKYSRILKSELKKFSTPLTPVPPLFKAKRPEEAVIYGCFEMSKDSYAKSSK